MNASRRESCAWHHAYRSGALTRRRRQTHLEKLKKIGLLSLPRDSRILDICCGEGEMLDLLAGQGFKMLVGMDYAEQSPARQAPSALSKDWDYVKGSAVELPFAAETFDWILCAHALHHLGGLLQIESLIREARRCLAPGGTFALIDHYDSIQLRAAFALLRSPAAELVPWASAFRKQLVEEKDCIGDYLSRWKQVEALFGQLPFQRVHFEKDWFFFYLKGQK